MDEVEQLVIEQVKEVQGRHPNLELHRDEDGRLFVRGGIRFSALHGSMAVEDTYQLELEIPQEYPESPPIVFETGGKIPRDFEHFMDAGNLCLEVPVENRRRFASHRNLLRFIDEQVVPYLFANSYKRDYGSLPFDDRLHGAAGLLQYYTEFFGTSNSTASTLQEFFEESGIPAMKLLKCLADAWAPPLMACPCGSGAKTQDCHGPKLDELRPHLPPRCFEDELQQIIAVAKQDGIRLPHKRVVPKRIWKKEERRLQQPDRRKQKQD